jgi:phosphohistidine phosphatase
VRETSRLGHGTGVDARVADREGSSNVTTDPRPMLVGLLRHGIAHDADESNDFRDELRELTDEGRARMRAASAGIATLDLAFASLVCSPLIRCVQTAEIVGTTLGLTPRQDPRVSPGMSAAGLVDLLLDHPADEAVLICGHQPDLSTVTGELVFGGLVEFKKGALALIELPEIRERSGYLTALYPPATLRRLGG